MIFVTFVWSLGPRDAFCFLLQLPCILLQLPLLQELVVGLHILDHLWCYCLVHRVTLRGVGGGLVQGLDGDGLGWGHLVEGLGLLRLER